MTHVEDITRLLSFTDMSNDDARRIQRSFQFIDIAGEEITAAKKRWKRATAKLNSSEVWRRVFPGDLIEYSEEVYRSHCREIFARAKGGQDIKPGTDAECLIALSKASLKAPLDGTHTSAMERCFNAVFPDKAIGGDAPRPAYAGADLEALETLRRKIGQLSSH